MACVNGHILIILRSKAKVKRLFYLFSLTSINAYVIGGYGYMVNRAFWSTVDVYQRLPYYLCLLEL